MFGTGRNWPDLVVIAGVMAALAISWAVDVVRQARQELAMLREEISRRRWLPEAQEAIK